MLIHCATCTEHKPDNIVILFNNIQFTLKGCQVGRSCVCRLGITPFIFYKTHFFHEVIHYLVTHQKAREHHYAEEEDPAKNLPPTLLSSPYVVVAECTYATKHSKSLANCS